MSPCASAERARQIGSKQDWNPARQANLPPVRMSAQHEVKPGVGGLPVDLWSVREQDGDTTVWNVCGRFFDVVGAVEMRVPPPPRDRSKPGPGAYGDGLVEQLANTKCFEVWNHGNRIVVAKHSIDVAAMRFTPRRATISGGKSASSPIAVGAPSIITRENTKIVVKVARESSATRCMARPLRSACKSLRCRIAKSS